MNPGAERSSQTVIARRLHRWRRVAGFAPDYLRSVMRREWQLALLALCGLAPGVAVLTAWLNLALHLRTVGVSASSHAGWLLPGVVLERLGLGGVLVGAGVVTLLIGGLGLANAYLASVERRAPQLALLHAAGLQRREVSVLLLLEAACAGTIGERGRVGRRADSQPPFVDGGRTLLRLYQPLSARSDGFVDSPGSGSACSPAFYGDDRAGLAADRTGAGLAGTGSTLPLAVLAQKGDGHLWHTLRGCAGGCGRSAGAAHRLSVSVGRVDGSARAAAHRGRMAGHVAVRTSAGADVGDPLAYGVARPGPLPPATRPD